jgi:hypothetical protein
VRLAIAGERFAGCAATGPFGVTVRLPDTGMWSASGVA